jgi:hypothetical protein
MLRRSLSRKRCGQYTMRGGAVQTVVRKIVLCVPQSTSAYREERLGKNSFGSAELGCRIALRPGDSRRKWQQDRAGRRRNLRRWSLTVCHRCLLVSRAKCAVWRTRKKYYPICECAPKGGWDVCCCAGFRTPAIDSRATFTGGRRPKAAKKRTRGDSAERLPRTPLWGLYERGHCQA